MYYNNHNMYSDQIMGAPPPLCKKPESTHICIYITFPYFSKCLESCISYFFSINGGGWVGQDPK